MNIRSLSLVTSAFLLCVPCASLWAAANLDAKAASSLISGRMWQQQAAHGPGKVYWSWKSDGSVCLRTDETSSKCADTGRWNLEGERMCYELTWWGASVGRKSACFRIVDRGKGKFEALQDSGFSLFEFSVVE